MKISKMSNTFNTPEWFDITQKIAINKEASTSNETNYPEEFLNEDSLVKECDKIEKCASASEKYYYNPKWDKNSISHLMEYAMACDMSKENIVPLKEEQKQSKISEVTKKQEIIVTASAKKTLNIGDAFRLDEKIANAERAENNWQVNHPQSKLAESPVMSGGIIPVRGGENIFINNNPNLAKNQNSIANANVIENLANSDIPDTGVRLANERKQKQANKIAENKQWEQSKIDAMPMRNIVSKGVVFPTECLNAQSGIGKAHIPGGSSFDPSNIPELTQGEMLKSASDERRKSIQNQVVADKWEEVNEAPKMRSISDDFSEQLKKALRK